MAEATEQYRPICNWSLDEAFRHLTRSVRLSDSEALYELEQLRVEVQKYIDGKPQGHPYYLHNNFRLHVCDHRWVIVEGLQGSDSRCRVAEQDVRAIQPAPSAGQPPLKPVKWLPLEHRRRQRLNDIPKDITTYTQQLHETAVEAVGLRRLTHAPTARRIETLLHELDLFPKIERRTKDARKTHD
jgi:hypothetical protein